MKASDTSLALALLAEEAADKMGFWFFCILCGEWQPMRRVTEEGTCQPCEEYVAGLMRFMETE